MGTNFNANVFEDTPNRSAIAHLQDIGDPLNELDDSGLAFIQVNIVYDEEEKTWRV